MVGLGVNIDHVATIRQARRTIEPSPVWAAAETELGGADCITFHLRADRRHINDRDAELLRQSVHCKLNMEMSLDPEIVEIACRLRPDQCTLVPENRQEVTTEGGLDAIAHAARLAEATAALRDAGTVVSAFIDPASEQIHASRDAGCQAIELHTGAYANAYLEGFSPAAQAKTAAALDDLREALAVGLGDDLVVHAGHGLTYNNIAPVAALDGFTEFNIGHSIIARAVFVGLRQAVADMKALLR